RHPTEDWQGITISTALPERRLFAFDLATGLPLWDHAPPPSWDGVNGDFAERMSVTGSPLVVGERVLVSCMSDESSIDYHVACYRIETGQLLWDRFVVRGQEERTNFEYLVREFAPPPLVSAPGQRVVTETGLGVVAALDAATGELLWRTEYPAI